MEWKNFDQLASYKKLAELAGSVEVKAVMAGENGAKRVADYQVPMSNGLTYSYAAKAVDEKCWKRCAIWRRKRP